MSKVITIKMPRDAIIVMEESIDDVKCLTFCKQRERDREREGIKKWKLAVITIEKVFYLVCLPGR